MSSVSDNAFSSGNPVLIILGIAIGCLGAFVGKKLEEEESERKADEARKTGYGDGRKDGENAVAKRLRDKMLANNKLKLGVFALGCYIAYIDGEFTKEEQAAIEQAVGKPDTSWSGIGFQDEVHKIMELIQENKMNFNDIVIRYLDDIDRETFEELDEVVMDVINADCKIAREEQDFLNNEWKTFKYRYA